MRRHPRSPSVQDESLLHRLALSVTQRVGTMFFFFAILVWTLGWLLWNIFAPKPLRFDPFPGFILWLFLSNMIQLFLMPLIMVGQNLQGRIADARAENDYRINCKAEAEIQEIRATLRSISEHLKIEPSTSKTTIAG